MQIVGIFANIPREFLRRVTGTIPKTSVFPALHSTGVAALESGFTLTELVYFFQKPDIRSTFSPAALAQLTNNSAGEFVDILFGM